MKKYIYAGYDKVAEMFNNPFVEVNDATATRGFIEAVKDNAHKNDYELYKIGEYTDHNGEITSTGHGPIKLYSGLDIKIGNVTEIKQEKTS